MCGGLTHSAKRKRGRPAGGSKRASSTGGSKKRASSSSSTTVSKEEQRRRQREEQERRRLADEKLRAEVKQTVQNLPKPKRRGEDTLDAVRRQTKKGGSEAGGGREGRGLMATVCAHSIGGVHGGGAWS